MPHSSVAPHTPILVGAGQVTETIPDLIENASSHTDIAARAALIALEDALPGKNIASHIDTIAAVRTFADTSPLWTCPFGGPDNLPRAIGARLGCFPKTAVYSGVGGQSPQSLVGEYYNKLASGEGSVVLLVGGEVVANIRAAIRQGCTLDWNETIGGQLDDRGIADAMSLFTRFEHIHNIRTPMQYYGLMETARRGDLGQTVQEYNRDMGAMFAGFSEVAAKNPYATYPEAFDGKTLIKITKKNPMVVSPYTKHLIAKDNVNQGAALLLTTADRARSLGIKESRWIYLRGYGASEARTLLERKKLGQSGAMKRALKSALNSASTTVEQISYFDLYSCFPIVVSNARELLGIDSEDPRTLTTTGGLPFFGGPGNNYSMHGIASLVRLLRNDPGSMGLVLANGGWMSKHAVGIYSSRPSTNGQPSYYPENHKRLTAKEAISKIDETPNGEATIESFIVNYHKGSPISGVIVGRLRNSGKRSLAVTDPATPKVFKTLLQRDPLGQTVYLSTTPKGNIFSFTGN